MQFFRIFIFLLVLGLLFLVEFYCLHYSSKAVISQKNIYIEQKRHICWSNNIIRNFKYFSVLDLRNVQRDSVKCKNEILYNWNLQFLLCFLNVFVIRRYNFRIDCVN